jgi:hypothetical protein
MEDGAPTVVLSTRSVAALRGASETIELVAANVRLANEQLEFALAAARPEARLLSATLQRLVPRAEADAAAARQQQQRDEDHQRRSEQQQQQRRQQQEQQEQPQSHNRKSSSLSAHQIKQGEEEEDELERKPTKGKRERAAPGSEPTGKRRA